MVEKELTVIEKRRGQRGLIPEKTVARFLISTSCRLVGEFATDELSINHAMPRERSQLMAQTQPGPFSRSYYIVSVTHEDHEDHGGVAFPNYLINAELIADLASVWFGKRFDVHGTLQEHGHFFIPALWAAQPVAYPDAGPFSCDPRKDLKINLAWNTFRPPFELFEKYSDGNSAIWAFWRATRFYARSLRSFDNGPEVAFFYLIAAIEMLAAEMDFADDQIFDPELLEILKRIREELHDGEAVEKVVRTRLYQLRRRVALCAVELTNDNFFEGSEAKLSIARLSKDDLFKRIKAAYDLRSQYAHTGADIGGWLNIFTANIEEICLGRPVMEDKKLAGLIVKAPTLAGLERLVRFMTLRFAHRKISTIHEGLV